MFEGYQREDVNYVGYFKFNEKAFNELWWTTARQPTVIFPTQDVRCFLEEEDLILVLETGFNKRPTGRECTLFVVAIHGDYESVEVGRVRGNPDIFWKEYMEEEG